MSNVLNIGASFQRCTFTIIQMTVCVNLNNSNDTVQIGGVEVDRGATNAIAKCGKHMNGMVIFKL